MTTIEQGIEDRFQEHFDGYDEQVEGIQNEFRNAAIRYVEVDLPQIDPTFPLTTEQVLDQFEDNWRIAQKIAVEILEATEPIHIHIQGEMGAGKTTIKQMVERLLRLHNQKVTTYKLPDGRRKEARGGVNGNSVNHPIEVNDSHPGGPVQQIIEEINNLPEDSVLVVSEAQFMGQPHDLETLVEDAKEKGITIITDSLKTLFDGTLHPGTKRLYKISDTRHEPQAVDVIDPNGEWLAFNIDQVGDAQLLKMLKDIGDATVNLRRGPNISQGGGLSKLLSQSAYTGDDSLLYNKTTDDPDYVNPAEVYSKMVYGIRSGLIPRFFGIFDETSGEIIGVKTIASARFDPEYIPGSVERYCKAYLGRVVYTLWQMGLKAEARAYYYNHKRSTDPDWLPPES